MDIPPPLTGEGEGGGGQDENLFGPPSPSSPPTEGRGDFVGLCLFNCGLLSNYLVTWAELGRDRISTWGGKVIRTI